MARAPSCRRCGAQGTPPLCAACKKAYDHAHRSRLDVFLRHLHHNLVRHAAARGLEVRNVDLGALRAMWAAQKGRCALSGLPMTHTRADNRRATRVNPFNVSVDRIDSARGYTPDNVRLVCAQCNLMKADLSDEEFRGFCRAVAARCNPAALG